jgi:hypothetical protein
MKIKALIVGAVTGIMMVSCAAGGSTPETATEAYVKALAMGECDKALAISTGSAVETVNGMIEAGCEKYETTIVKTSCEVSGDNATCICIEQEDTLTFKTFKYELEKIEGDWKVASAGKDMPGMPSMDEMGMDEPMMEMEESMEEVGEAIEGAVEEIGSEVENGLESVMNGLQEAADNIDNH